MVKISRKEAIQIINDSFSKFYNDFKNVKDLQIDNSIQLDNFISLSINLRKSLITDEYISILKNLSGIGFKSFFLFVGKFASSYLLSNSNIYSEKEPLEVKDLNIELPKHKETNEKIELLDSFSDEELRYDDFLYNSKIQFIEDILKDNAVFNGKEQAILRVLSSINLEDSDKFLNTLNNGLEEKLYNKINFKEQKILKKILDNFKITNQKIETFNGWIVYLNDEKNCSILEYKKGNDVMVIDRNGNQTIHEYPNKGSRAGFLASFINLPIKEDGTSPKTEDILTKAGYSYSKIEKCYIKNKNALDKFTVYGTKKPKEEIRMTYYRDPKSYKPSFNRNKPRNEYLDFLIMDNLSKQITIKISDIQTVANYPDTYPDSNSDSKKHKRTYNDTIAAGNVQFKYKTTSDVAPGPCLVIINTKTIDNRDVNDNGYTTNALSDGRGLVHSSERPDGKGDWEHAYSEQCFICKRSEDHKKIMQTLKDWGCKENDIIQGKIIDLL